ncbi:MAG TPA: DUF4199 domain-containing protein [Chitinophagaceae bacterium]|nr:DUF4199 domain-containing protein [Chitinophagaceae bacterium]
MKKTVLRYGLLASVTVVGLFVFGFTVLRKMGYESQEVYGYTSMVLALLFVFFGIRHYRDKVNNGVLSFGKGMKVGTLIVLIPALAFGIFDVLYVLVFNPEFFDQYMEHQLKSMKETMSAAEFEVAAKQLAVQQEMFSNPLITFTVMFLTVFMIGIIVTVISSLILRRAR